MRIIAVLAGALLALAGAHAQSGKTEVQWLSHASFRITSPGGKVIVIDPALTVMPTTPPEYKKLEALGKVDVLLVTHGHWDHITDAPALAALNNIPMHAPGDLNNSLTTLGVLPAKQLPRFNKSGRITPVPGIKVTAVRAEHSSIYVWRNPATGKDETHPGGEPIGYIIELENGFRIWHMGDTGLFGDMKMIGELYKPDVVLTPIGGNFTINPQQAAMAIRDMIKPRFAIPMHYGTYPILAGKPEDFVKALEGSSTRAIVMNPGDKVDF